MRSNGKVEHMETSNITAKPINCQCIKRIVDSPITFRDFDILGLRF